MDWIDQPHCDPVAGMQGLAALVNSAEPQTHIAHFTTSSVRIDLRYANSAGVVRTGREYRRLPRHGSSP